MHEIHIKIDTVAKKEIEQSILLSDDKKKNYKKGLIVLAEEIREVANDHCLVKLYPSKERWFLYKSHIDIKWGDLISFDKLIDCFPEARKIDVHNYHDPINLALSKFEINNSFRIAAFLAQIAHESGSLKYKEELASGIAYEARKDLGNINPGDGKRYKGRGLIQLTGRSNYTWASKALGIDLINNPTLATTPTISAKIAGLYWQSRGLNKLADMNTIASFRDITKKINGGLNGWIDRLAKWQHIKKVIY